MAMVQIQNGTTDLRELMFQAPLQQLVLSHSFTLELLQT
jgi:hypothetical protein